MKYQIDVLANHALQQLAEIEKRFAQVENFTL